jgi:glycosyltransferase involved in cell wall biosynthesis
VKLGVLVPIYDHGRSIGAVIEGLAASGLPCLVVDDGSGPATREALENVEKRHPFVRVLRRPSNGGKGAALKTGYREALAGGLDGVIQLDADGQHDPADVPRFVRAMKSRPGALVLGVPVFDESVPASRLYARQISRVLVWMACLSRVVPDPLCGYRGIPLGPTLALLDRITTGDRMDFEPELAVRLVWAGVPVVPIPTRVVYPADGLSHFSLLRDYPRLAGLYARLALGMLPRSARLLLRARLEAQEASG